ELLDAPVANATVLEAARPDVPEGRVPDVPPVHVGKDELAGLGTERTKVAEDREHLRVQLDTAPRSARLRLADGPGMVARLDVGDALAEVDVVPRKRRRLARTCSVPPQEEHVARGRARGAVAAVQLRGHHRARQGKPRSVLAPRREPGRLGEP